MRAAVIGTQSVFRPVRTLYAAGLTGAKSRDDGRRNEKREG